MKTHDEILERYLSEESADAFSAQKLALLCLLPYEMAKPHLTPEYVNAADAGTLSEEEQWQEGLDPKESILSTLPEFYKAISNLDTVNMFLLMEAFLHIKALVWVLDESVHDEISELYVGDPAETSKQILDRVSTLVGYIPYIEDADFEEVTTETAEEEEEGSSSPS